MVYGDDQPFIAAFINIDAMTVGKWAEDKGLSYTTYMDLSQQPEVAKPVLQEVNQVNKNLNEAERIYRFVLLYKLLDADDEELTRTGKVRRGFMGERYAEILGALYQPELGEVSIKAEFRCQDGQVNQVETAVRILEADRGQTHEAEKVARGVQ